MKCRHRHKIFSQCDSFALALAGVDINGGCISSTRRRLLDAYLTRLFPFHRERHKPLGMPRSMWEQRTRNWVSISGFDLSSHIRIHKNSSLLKPPSWKLCILTIISRKTLIITNIHKEKVGSKTDPDSRIMEWRIINVDCGENMLLVSNRIKIETIF